MIYRELGNTGMKVSALGLGTNRLRTCTQEEATAIINRLLDLGVNFLSSGYHETQALIGNAVSHRRDEYFISSKCTQETARGVREGIEESLRLLKLDYLDVYEMDYITDWAELARMLAPGGAYEALVEAKNKGLIRHIGTTSHRPEIIAWLIRHGLVETATFMVSMVQQYAIEEVLPIAREKGVGTISIRPSDHGALAPYDRALAFAMHSGVTVTLSGMTSVDQVESNVAAAEKALAMSPDEVEALKAEAASLPRTDCRNCVECQCPYELRIGFTLPLHFYRQKYGLLPDGVQMWERNRHRAIVAAHHCDDCGLCEPMCPYGVPIVKYVKEIAGAT